MLLVDSLYINNSGGKVLLDYLVEELEKSGKEVYYLFDDRCKKDYQYVTDNRKIFLKASLINRFRFYKLNQKKFSKILCFGNIPPVTQQKCEVLTYFHQPLFVMPNDPRLPFRTRVKLSAQKLMLKVLANNSDKWIVQQEVIMDGLSKRYNIGREKIHILPFYPPMPRDSEKTRRKQSTFIYVSSGAPHKNQIFLIDSFCQFFDKCKLGHLTLTVAEPHTEVLKYIESKMAEGYPIINLGYIKRENLCQEYQSHEYLVFPSLAESFGLGIIEAVESGCKVIGADLPYMHNVCSPSFLFDPYDSGSLVKAFENAVQIKDAVTIPKISDEIHQLLNII